jgi:hypothetical protein
MTWNRAWIAALLVCGCDGGGDRDAGPRDAGRDAHVEADAGTDPDAGPGPEDAGADARDFGCIEEGHEPGERYPVGDGCNFCDCAADGTTVCTDRTCAAEGPRCTYDGVEHAFAERFPATDGCNECVCAASGVACTRREECGGVEEGAILLESLDAPCGENPEFTPRSVIEGLPTPDFTTAFPYSLEEPYPESLGETMVRIRIVYDGGFLVCRLPTPEQPSLDIEVMMEWMTRDGAFDETFHTYLQRNDFGFVDAWLAFGVVPHGSLDGTYVPPCPNPADLLFTAKIETDGSASGDASKICDFDIAVPIATWTYEN